MLTPDLHKLSIPVDPWHNFKRDYKYIAKKVSYPLGYLLVFIKMIHSS